MLAVLANLGQVSSVGHASRICPRKVFFILAEGKAPLFGTKKECLVSRGTVLCR